jgi:Uma2 family endonuclease
MASPDSTRNDQLTGFIRFLVQGYATVKQFGKVFGSRFAFELSPIRAPEPDVAFVLTARLHLVEETRMKGAPNIAVEIVAREAAPETIWRRRIYTRLRECGSIGSSTRYSVAPNSIA